MLRILLKNGRVLDPANSIDGLFDVVIMNGRIASLQEAGKSFDGEGGAPAKEAKDWEVIDCKGLLILPGLVDIHTHLREPGEEYKETIKTGTEAAAAGGVTTILCMANTTPVNDNASVTRLITDKAKADGIVNVRPIGAVTMGLKGCDLTEFAELKEAGCVALSDDGIPIASAALMRRALEYARLTGMPVISHAEDTAIVDNGVMNEGVTSTKLGLRGIPNAAEDIMVARDVALAELTGGRLHIAHVSTEGAVDIIRSAKARGVKVTAEVAPHHLLLTDAAVCGYNTDAKMNPPLRTQADIDALIAGLTDGTIDAIATDHAPHSSIEKDVEFDSAANGVVGLETSLALMLGLVNDKALSLETVVGAMTINPSKLMGLNTGTLGIGREADITLIDLKGQWTVAPEDFHSKGRNTPFKGMELKGRVVRTLVSGKTVFELNKGEAK